ncbi:unnamed protein product [Heligmosomoides polygyrus]|uniref:SERPIN domain-containing protein n=1 Tax=Heligmosomoides polygyrus TaxID=6339 RepID=A0A183F8N3_HELPZ|nr:unnamed protein product [Heligmosomoides polygyrus]
MREEGARKYRDNTYRPPCSHLGSRRHKSTSAKLIGNCVKKPLSFLDYSFYFRASSPPEPTTPVFPKTPIVRTKNTAVSMLLSIIANLQQPKTTFERLAVDYKERLTGAGDMDKILKSLYSNAYIALVDAKDASNIFG